MPSELASVDAGLSAAATFSTFEAPGAGTHAGQGTLATSINSTGAVAGYYLDSSKATHGFVRAANGSITSFDPPGAANTEALSINSAGAITGYFTDSSGVHHGFVRAANGAITTLNEPTANTGTGYGTVTYAINDPCGAITGFFVSSLFGAYSGLVRYPDGTFGQFDAPNAGNGPGEGTFAVSINSAPCPTIAGFYLDFSNVSHGFVRAPDGTFATFEVQGAGTGSQQGTQPRGINSANTVTGSFIDFIGANHGFVRAVNGAITSITTFDAPGAGTGASQGTQVRGINAGGVITGYYVDSSNVNHGFIRTP
jgi:hypothetical protein